MNQPQLRVSRFRSLLLFCVALTGHSLAQTGAPVAICIGEGSEWAPYTYWERVDGKPDRSRLTGAATLLVLEALKMNRLEHEIRYLPWARVQLELEMFSQNGVCEITWDASFKQERATKFYYTTPLYRTHLGVFYSTGTLPTRPVLHRLADLHEYRLCGVIGYNYEAFRIAENQIRQVKAVQQVLDMLSLGRCDLFPSEIEPMYGGVAIGAYTMPADVRSLRIPGLQKTFHALVAKTSPRAEHLLARLNQAIIVLQATGRAEQFFTRHLPDGSGLLP